MRRRVGSISDYDRSIAAEPRRIPISTTYTRKEDSTIVKYIHVTRIRINIYVRVCVCVHESLNLEYPIYLAEGRNEGGTIELDFTRFLRFPGSGPGVLKTVDLKSYSRSYSKCLHERENSTYARLRFRRRLSRGLLIGANVFRYEKGRKLIIRRRRTIYNCII